MAHVVPPTGVVDPTPDDYKRIGSGNWVIVAWFFRKRPEMLKAIYLKDHASYSIVAALLATISAALLMQSPANFVSSASAAQWIFVVSSSISMAADVTAILIATEMYLCSILVPPECFVWFLIENTHKGFAREPALWLGVGIASLCTALSACVALNWGGLFWIPVAATLGCALAIVNASAPLRWRGLYRGLRHMVKDESDLHLFEHGARTFLACLAEKHKGVLPSDAAG